MGLNLGRSAAPVREVPAAEMEKVQSYDIVEDRKQMNTELVGSQEVTRS